MLYRKTKFLQDMKDDEFNIFPEYEESLYKILFASISGNDSYSKKLKNELIRLHENKKKPEDAQILVQNKVENYLDNENGIKLNQDVNLNKRSIRRSHSNYILLQESLENSSDEFNNTEIQLDDLTDKNMELKEDMKANEESDGKVIEISQMIHEETKINNRDDYNEKEEVENKLKLTENRLDQLNLDKEKLSSEYQKLKDEKLKSEIEFFSRNRKSSKR